MSVQLGLKEGSLVFEDNGSYLQGIVSYINIPRLLSDHSPLITRYFSKFLQLPRTRVVALDTHSAQLVNPYVHASLGVSLVLFPAAPIAPALHTLSHRFGDDCLLLLLPRYSACACPYGESPAPTETLTKAPDNDANFFLYPLIT